MFTVGHRGRERRSVAALLAVGSVVALIVSGCAPESGGGTARSDLEKLLRAAPRIERFEFDHAAGGTRVNDCFTPNQRFSGAVDRQNESLVITDERGPLVVVNQRTAFVRGSLFVVGTEPAEWLRIDAGSPEAARDAISRALAPELAGYALAGGLPPSGNDTATAALTAASKVQRLSRADFGAQTAERFRLTVPSEELTDAAGPSRSSTSLGDAVVEVWVTEGGYVARVAVRPAPTPRDGEDDDPGWTVEYRPLAAAAPPPDTSAAAPIGSIDVSLLAAPKPPVCEVPL